MGRVEENKQQKLNRLMETAFQLFTSQGLTKTSIAEIAELAGVAKGTFYLYFKDKYDLHEKLVIRKSEQLFLHALEESDYRSQPGAAGKVLALVDDILFQLRDNKVLLQFINKNLSWGVFRRAINKWQQARGRQAAGDRGLHHSGAGGLLLLQRDPERRPRGVGRVSPLSAPERPCHPGQLPGPACGGLRVAKHCFLPGTENGSGFFCIAFPGGSLYNGHGRKRSAWG